jgi:hypothetical protein
MDASSNRIYRANAIAHLSSPEQLDELVSINQPADWAAVAVLIIGICVLFAWSVFGSIPTVVEGLGVLLEESGPPASVRDRALLAAIEQELARPDATSAALKEHLSRLVSEANEQRTAQFALLYIPAERAADVKSGLPVRLEVAALTRKIVGVLLGTVLTVCEKPSSIDEMRAVVGNEAQTTQFSRGACAVHVTLLPDKATPSGYRWSKGNGPPQAPSTGSLVRGEITVREQPPWRLLLPISAGGQARR